MIGKLNTKKQEILGSITAEEPPYMILVKVNLVKRGHGSCVVSVIESNGEEREISVSSKSLIEKDGEYFITCSDEPIPGAERIDVDATEIITFSKDHDS
jgi:hypothetical protein